MIFVSKNEDGVPAWELILKDEKTVTRRLKPVEVGKIIAVCPGRGKFAVCKAKVLSCEEDEFWQERQIREAAGNWWTEEAHKEGFKTWDGLWEWIRGHHKGPLPKMYRIEFEAVNKRPPEKSGAIQA